MSGFIYIWRDRKTKRFYIGSHWGEPDDGYVCSSLWMKRAYARRPHDFKRRIVATSRDRVALLEEEQRWLNMIHPSEIKKRYYNIITRVVGHWARTDHSRMTVAERISASSKGKIFTPEHKAALSAAQKGKKRKPMSAETKAKIAATKVGKPCSASKRAKISATLKAKYIRDAEDRDLSL